MAEAIKLQPPSKRSAAGPGFEPGKTASKAAVIPFHHPALYQGAKIVERVTPPRRGDLLS